MDLTASQSSNIIRAICQYVLCPGSVLAVMIHCIGIAFEHVLYTGVSLYFITKTLSCCLSLFINVFVSCLSCFNLIRCCLW